MLKIHGDEGSQMEALSELCEVLSMGQEEILIGFSVDSFLPVLVEILNMEHRPEMMLLSCRAITHLLEVMPKAAPKVAASGAVPIFCQRLLTIEFIDVAEQSLLAMHKLSVEHPEPLLRSSGLSAVLTFIDFFDMNTQRTAIATAANMCRNIPPDSFPLVVDMIPNMTALLSSCDNKMVESACMCFSRLVDSCHTSEMQLEEIASPGALLQLVRLLRPADGEGRSFELSTGTYTSVVKTLAMSCRGSPKIAVMLLEEGIVQVFLFVWYRLRILGEDEAGAAACQLGSVCKLCGRRTGTAPGVSDTVPLPWRGMWRREFEHNAAARHPLLPRATRSSEFHPEGSFCIVSQAILPDISFPNRAPKTRKNTILRKIVDRRMACGTRAFGSLHPNTEFACQMPEFSQVAGMWFPLFVHVILTPPRFPPLAYKDCSLPEQASLGNLGNDRFDGGVRFGENLG